MNPAVGSHAAGSPDDAARAALQGASLAFQKRPIASNSSNTHPQNPPSSLTTALRSAKQSSGSRSSRSNSPPPLHNQQHGLEHYRENGALLAATSSVERAKSPGGALALTPLRSPHVHPNHGAADVSALEIESETTLPAGLVAARLQQLGVAPATAAAITNTASPVNIAIDRAPSRSPSSHLAKGLSPQTPANIASTLATLDAKSPSLIAATLAASRSASPTPAASKKPRRVHSVKALQEVDAVDSQPIPSTNSLISIFEQDKPTDSDSPTRRSKPRSSPDRQLTRKSARVVLDTPEKPVTMPSSPISSPRSKQRRSKAQMDDSLPTSSQANEKKTKSALPRRPPTPPAGMNRAVASAPETPVASSKAIASIVAKKPRVTPPRAREAVDSLSNAVMATQVTPQSKSTKTIKTPTISGEVDSARQPSQKQSTSRLARESHGNNLTGKPPALDNVELTTPTTPRQKSPTPHVISRSTPEVLSPKPKRLTKSASLQYNTPPPSIILRPTSGAQSSPSPDPKKRQMEEKRPPTPPKPRNSNRLAPTRPGSGRPRGNSDARVSQATPVNSMWGLPIVSNTTSNTPKASKSPPAPPQKRRESIVSAPPSPTHEPPRRQRFTQPPSNPMQLSSMTNAIMASSLASSRLTPHNTGTSLPPPPLPNRQRSPHLLQTLRRPQSEPEEEHDRQRKTHKNLLHSSKHTHHEGSRKRWRDQLTERERKRYEGLWASNRGLLLTYESPSASVGSGLGTELSECVVNIVVREIWKRSRLPMDELAEVWELVDREHKGYLTRQEFVVGMFLIDQRLRGRKLPQKVSDSIWGSVNGVTVLRPRLKH